MKPLYNTPKLIKPKNPSLGWYVYFMYNKVPFRKRFDCNRIKDLEEREYEFNQCIKLLTAQLKSGWDPTASIVQTELSNKTLNEALTFALEKKKPNVSSKTYTGYLGTVNFVITSAKLLSLDTIKVVDLRRVHVKLIFEKLVELRGWSNKAYNKNLNYLKAILSELVQWDIIENNPAFKIAALPEDESFVNTPASMSDMKKIKEELETNHVSFYIFVITIFHTGIRPQELLNLTLGMVNLKKSEITLPATITKTRKQRIVPINNYLIEFYKGLDFGSLSKDYYLFGSFKEPAVGNRGGNQTLPDFIPGPTKISRDTATRRWEKIVKTGLKIDMNLYAMKHYGADQKILSGISLDTLRELYGHKSILMTEKYAKIVKEVYRRQIIDQSPDF